MGRTGKSSVRLDDPSVSWKHCLVRRSGAGGLEIVDLNSRIGARHNGSQVERAALAVGDRLPLGDVEITVEALTCPPLGTVPPKAPPA